MRRASIAIVLLLLACGGGQKVQLQTAREGLSVALTATSAARETMLTWSQAREAAIVRAASSKEQGEAALAAHRVRVDSAVLVFAATYTALAAASSALALASSDEGKLADAVRLVGDALRAAIAVREAVAALKGGAS